VNIKPSKKDPKKKLVPAMRNGISNVLRNGAKNGFQPGHKRRRY